MHGTEPAKIPDDVEALKALCASLAAMLAERDAKIVERDAKITERDAKLAEREAKLARAAASYALLEAKFAAAGGAGPLAFELGAAPPPEKNDFIDPAIPETPGGAPEGARWKDVTEGAAPSAGGALKKAEGVFGGKVKVVKKPSP